MHECGNCSYDSNFYLTSIEWLRSRISEAVRKWRIISNPSAATRNQLHASVYCATGIHYIHSRVAEKCASSKRFWCTVVSCTKSNQRHPNCHALHARSRSFLKPRTSSFVHSPICLIESPASVYNRGRRCWDSFQEMERAFGSRAVLMARTKAVADGRQVFANDRFPSLSVQMRWWVFA